MPKKPSTANPSSPGPTRQHRTRLLDNLKRDLQACLSDSTELAKALKAPCVLPEHFLLSLLIAEKFHAYMDTLFERHHKQMDEVVQALMDKLAPPPETPSSDDEPKASAELSAMAAALESIAEKQSGYCLPPLCLQYFFGELPDNPLVATLGSFGIDAQELQSDIRQMARENPEDLAPSAAIQSRHSGQAGGASPEQPPADSFEEAMKSELQLVAHASSRLALRMQHAYLLPEHLFLAFLQAEEFSDYTTEVFERRHHTDRKELEEQLLRYLQANNEKLKEGNIPEITPAYKRVITQVISQLKSAQDYFFPAMFLLGMLQVECFSAMFIRQILFEPGELLRDVRMMKKPRPRRPADGLDENGNELPSRHRDDSDFLFDEDEDPMPPFNIEDDIAFGDGLSPREPVSALETFGMELVALAKEGKIDPMVGRQQELERMIEILHKKRSGNALIVGNEGVGKTAIVEGLAWRIAHGKVPPSLRGYKIYSLNLGAMVAGSELRGAFERRLDQCIKEIIAQPKCFLFIDEIHTMLGAGTGREGTLDASNIIKPHLARGELRCIGATTYDEYQKRFLNDRAFARRFMKIDLAEPTAEETLQILKGLAKSYAKYHGVKIPANILRLIVELSERHIHEKYFLDKAIEIMDECGARYHSGLAAGNAVTRDDVEQVVCRIANLPSLAVHDDDSSRLQRLEERLKENIYGQDETIHELAQRVKVAKAGFQDPRKPLLCAFLCGPSGCGKTALARQLADELGIAFVKLDMSEFSEEYAASRLVGSAPGYVGYDRPGALTEPVIQTPHCLLLLDEIEKAHAAVFNLLLQVLDEGRLRDNKGREASYRNAIIIMTSNVGSRAAADAINLLGFNKSDDDQMQNRQEIIQRVMKQTFPPEFRNRIQVTRMMNGLTLEALKSIVEKTLRMANRQLASRKVVIQLTSEAVDQIARRAAVERLGGRPVERIFEEVVKQKLVDALLFGKLAKGGQATVDFRNQDFQYRFA